MEEENKIVTPLEILADWPTKIIDPAVFEEARKEGWRFLGKTREGDFLIHLPPKEE